MLRAALIIAFVCWVPPAKSPNVTTIYFNPKMQERL